MTIGTWPKSEKSTFFLCMLEHRRWYHSKALVKLSPLQSSLGKSTMWIKSYERSKFRARGPSRGLAGLQSRKFSKFGDQRRSAPKSLWILFKVGQTRLGHSRGDWREKVFLAGSPLHGRESERYIFFQKFSKCRTQHCAAYNFFSTHFHATKPRYSESAWKTASNKLHEQKQLDKKFDPKFFGRTFLSSAKFSKNFILVRFFRRWSQKMRNKKWIRHAKFENNRTSG